MHEYRESNVKIDDGREGIETLGRTYENASRNAYGSSEISERGGICETIIKKSTYKSSKKSVRMRRIDDCSLNYREIGLMYRL